MKNLISRLHGRMLALSLLGFSLIVALVPAAASAQTTTPDPVTSGDAGLTTGVNTLTSFLYSALPILLGLAVAAAIVRWVYRRVTSGAH